MECSVGNFWVHLILMSFNSDVSLCIFGSDVLFIGETGVLITHLLITELELICLFKSTSILSVKLRHICLGW